MLTLFFLGEYRQKSFWGAVAAILLVCWAAGLFGGALALIEERETVLTLAAWLLRLLLVAFLVIWWVSSLARERAERFEQVLLSLPLSRFSLLAQRLAAWLAVAGAVALAAGLLLELLGAHWLFALQWTLSFVLELWLVAALALFVTNVLRGVGSGAIGVFLFYLFLRLDAYVAALARGRWTENETLDQAVSTALHGVLHLLPSLYQYANATMILHGASWALLGWQALQSGVFVLLLLLAGGFDFNRKEAAT